ncbi:MAG: hypothetical protein ABI323_02430 [Solirubrobacteraceae bacterium]
MTLYATIGAKALYLLFVWLGSAAAAGWMADRKGYGERLGLTFGLILSAVGFLIVLLLPGRPGSAWKVEGPLPRRRRSPAGSEGPGPPARSAGPPSGPPSGSAGSPAGSPDAPAGPPA